METDHQQSAHEELVDALMQSGGQIALIVSHMAEFSTAAPRSGPGCDAVLRHLATDVLEASLLGVSDDDLRAAARIVLRASDVIGEQLILVPPDAELFRPTPPPIPRHRRRPL